MTKNEALKLALEALKRATNYDPVIARAITAIKESLAQPEQEPVAWATREDFYFELNRRVERMRKEMEVKTVTMRCKEYDLALPIIDMYGGHIVVGQVSFPPQRKPLMDEEIRKANHHMVDGAYDYSFKQGVKWAEYKHGIKGES